MHEYCQERLAEAPEEQRQALDRHGAYFIGFIRDRESERWGSKVPELLVEYDEELENLRAAWRWAVAGHHLAELQQSAQAFMWYTDIRSRYQDGIDTYAHAVQGLDENDPQQSGVLSFVLTLQSHLLFRQGRLTEATHQVERGLRLAEPLGKTDAITTAMYVLGTVAELKGDYLGAKRYHQEAIALSRVLDWPDIFAALKNLANVELALGHYQQAQDLFHEALALCRRRDNPLGVVLILSNFGGLTLLTDGPDEARALLEEGLELAHEIGFRMEIPYLMRNLAEAAYDLEAFEEAETLCLEALDIARENATRTGEAAVLAMLGRVMMASGRHDEGQACFRQSLELSWANQELARALETLVLLAASHVERGRHESPAQWLSLAVRHPATPHRFRTVARRLLDSLQSQHPEVELNEMMDAAQASELREVMEGILNNPA